MCERSRKKTTTTVTLSVVPASIASWTKRLAIMSGALAVSARRRAVPHRPQPPRADCVRLGLLSSSRRSEGSDAKAAGRGRVAALTRQAVHDAFRGQHVPKAIRREDERTVALADLDFHDLGL